MTQSAPKWDLTPWFSGLVTDDYREAFARRAVGFGRPESKQTPKSKTTRG